MEFEKHVPLIVAPYSESIVGGISSWTKNMLDYAEKTAHQDGYQILCYSNHLMSVTNTKKPARIATGIILYSKLVYKLGIFIMKYKPSVLHITTSATLGLIKDIIIIWLGKLTNTPVIFHWRFGRIPDLSKKNNWEWKLLNYVVKNSKGSIVIDRKSYNTLFEYGFTNVIDIPNPIPLDIEKRAETKLKINSERVPGRILFVGHVIPDKGVFELVKACIEVSSVSELILIGPYEKDIKNELVTLSKKRENGEWLKILGQLNKEEVLKYMENTRILILPSFTEGFPNVVIEAMAMGCAIIATDVGAIPEMIDSGKITACGICVPVRNVEKLIGAMADLATNTDKSDRMGRNGIKKVLSNYTLGKIVDQYTRIWDDASKIKKV